MLIETKDPAGFEMRTLLGNLLDSIIHQEAERIICVPFLVLLCTLAETAEMYTMLSKSYDALKILRGSRNPRTSSKLKKYKQAE